MDQSINFVIDKKIERTIEALKNNNINAYLVNSDTEIIDKIKEILPEGSSVACGGSMTLFETGVIEHLRSERYDFLDRFAPNLSPQDMKKIFRESFSVDGYLASSNAVTEDGKLYNVDGNGNRVAAMMYGPDKVILVVGVNKIVKDIDEAINRNREIAAPANSKRLNLKNPCAKVGYCMDCKSPDRICQKYTIIDRQAPNGRVHVIFIKNSLGY